MSFKMQRVHVYRGEVKDEPGGISSRLKVLAESGANLEYVYSERSVTRPGYGNLFVAPLTSAEHIKTARAIDMHEVNDPVVMRVTGDNKAGLAGRLTQAWEKAGINLHGMVMATHDTKFVGYVTFDTVNDANHAATILAELGSA